MEIFVMTAGAYLILNALVASQAGKFKRNPAVSFLIGMVTTPIGGWIYLQNGKKRGIKRVKNKGPWNEWLAKAHQMEEEENWDGARKAYLKALDLLKNMERNSSKKFSKKYLQSKTSEINYNLDLLKAKSSEETKVVQLPKSPGGDGAKKASNDL